MTYAAPLAQAHPSKPDVDVTALAEAIQACFDCVQACTADADADLDELDVRTMVRCIHLCLDCADVCLATGKILAPGRFRPRDRTRCPASLRADL